MWKDNTVSIPGFVAKSKLHIKLQQMILGYRAINPRCPFKCEPQVDDTFATFFFLQGKSYRETPNSNSNTNNRKSRLKGRTSLDKEWGSEFHWRIS